jgi:phosphate transport system protein
MLNKYKEKLDEINGTIEKIGNSLIDANKLILEALETCDIEKFSEAKLCIKNISKKTDEVDNKIVTTLALHAPEAKDLRDMVACLKITNELLRAASNTRSFVKGFVEVCSEVDVKTINEYAIPMQRSTVESLQEAIKMISLDCVDETQECFNNVLIAENKTDDLYEMVENAIFNQAKAGDDFGKYHNMLSALRKSEKIADRAMSIASLLLYVKNGGEIHQR